MYQGKVDGIAEYFSSMGLPCPIHANPADWAIRIVNTDFRSSRSLDEEFDEHESGIGMSGVSKSSSPQMTLDQLSSSWDQYSSTPSKQPNSHLPLHTKSASSDTSHMTEKELEEGSSPRSLTHTSSHSPRLSALQSIQSAAYKTNLLMLRAFYNYSRNLLAYGIRLGMYAGMGFLLATIWIRLKKEDGKINDRLSVFFFSVAFLGFMSVAGIPSFLEERSVFVRERSNGLYGPGVYVLANSIVTLPFLFLCSLLFCLICYWAIGLHPGASAFFKFLSFLFLAVYVAESQSILIAAAIPIFVAALAIAAFANGFWMCVQGYFIRAVNLPRFWYYWAHFIDYQTFAFNTLVVNEFRGEIYECTTPGSQGECHCSIPSSLPNVGGQCQLSGEDVLKSLDLEGIDVTLYVFILVIIALVYRLMFWGVLVHPYGAHAQALKRSSSTKFEVDVEGPQTT